MSLLINMNIKLKACLLIWTFVINCMTVYLPLLLQPGMFSILHGLLTLIFMVSCFILPIPHLYYLSIHLGNNGLVYRQK